MTDEIEEGPDPNDVRRHAKRMLTEWQYRQKYRRIDFYRPNDKQLAFHNLTAREAMLRAGNQNGKTHAGGAQATMDALCLYPNWYKGRRFIDPPAIERPFDFMAWAASTTSTKTRDGVQLKLLGPIRDDGGLGTGLIPLENIIGRPTMARGISDFVDTVMLRRENGGRAQIRFKTFEMGREAFQGEPVDLGWLDEDVSRDDDSIHGEMLARLVTTNGRLIYTMTPLLGMSPLRKHFKQHAGDACREVLMTINDCAASKGGHIPDERIPEIIASFPEHERATRAFGSDMQGEGAVFMTPVDRIKFQRDPAGFPEWWAWLWALDFSHSGMSAGGHPFAAVLGAWDRDNDVIYVVEAIRMAASLPVNHVAAIKSHPMGDVPVAWPHDGGRAAGLVNGETIAAMYRRLGLNMRNTNARLPESTPNARTSLDFEVGITMMAQRFETGKLKIAAHLTDVFDEYQGYHRVNGLVNKIDDDLMSAIRVLCMDIRYAKTIDEWRNFRQRRTSGETQMARDVDFDVHAC